MREEGGKIKGLSAFSWSAAGRAEMMEGWRMDGWREGGKVVVALIARIINPLFLSHAASRW